MPIVVNSNPAATTAAFNLSKNHANLSKSLARLSSGQRITESSDDAGGMAVAYKLNSTVMRTQAALNNHQNALSYLQVQDGALESVGNIVSRMAELRTMAADITKNDGDIENYSKEFRELQSQLQQDESLRNSMEFVYFLIKTQSKVAELVTTGLEKASANGQKLTQMGRQVLMILTRRLLLNY